VHLAVAILDYACLLGTPPSEAAALADGSGSWVELLGIAALLLACKFQEVEIHMIDEFVFYANARYAPIDVLEAETRICASLRFDFAIPPAIDFLYCLLQRLNWPATFAVHRGMHKQVVMLAHLLCEIALLAQPTTPDEPTYPASLLACCALCLSLACLRCGLWRDGSPGPSTTPEQYWTPSMAQATGYSRAELRTLITQLQHAHADAHADLASNPVVQPQQWGRWGVVRHKFSQPRFLGVLKVPPFTPHTGGSLYSPLHNDLVRAPLSSPLAHALAAP